MLYIKLRNGTPLHAAAYRKPAAHGVQNPFVPPYPFRWRNIFYGVFRHWSSLPAASSSLQNLLLPHFTTRSALYCRHVIEICNGIGKQVEWAKIHSDRFHRTRDIKASLGGKKGGIKICNAMLDNKKDLLKNSPMIYHISGVKSRKMPLGGANWGERGRQVHNIKA